MRAVVAGLVLGLTLAACQTSPEVPTAPVTQMSVSIPVDCDIEVVFGSYAMGADQALRGRVRELLASNTGVGEFSEKRWGREGESTFCIHAINPGAADSLYTTIAGWIPDSSDRHPTSVAHRDGRSRAATWPG
ncbi:hypothetical protein GCM10009101_15110 [Brevundimonas lenta]